MDSRVKKLMGSNMDIDFISDVKFGDSQCPWNVAEGANAHKCAVKNISICKYFCGVQLLDSVLCSYPYEAKSVLTRDETDRNMYSGLLCRKPPCNISENVGLGKPSAWKALGSSQPLDFIPFLNPCSGL